VKPDYQDDPIVQGIAKYQPKALYAMFSGGHDSICSTHVASTLPGFQGVIHINTGIGIEDTTKYVRETCEHFGWHLWELRPEVEYEDLVLERGGFPSGPQSHNSMLFHLKQRPLRQFIQIVKEKRSDKIALVTGVRHQESQRRMNSGISVPVRKDGAKLWLNPILNWTERDKNAYMEEHGLPRNQVTDLLHRSGECLCGALARREELADIVAWYPEAGQRILDLEARCKAEGLDAHKWAGKPQHAVAAGQEQLFESPLCVGCARAAA
jgi:3'-phosphoadenosine 5'-phosphosulfate sulfotransferase (PAPS reductase)/FAD synthetase